MVGIVAVAKPLYVIANWNDHFENNRTRELKSLAWVPMPNRHDGDGYTELMDHPKAASHYGAWCSLVQIASKCDPRGTLVRAGQKPHDSGSLSRITRIPVEVYEQAIPRLVQIGWLKCVTDLIDTTCSNPAGGCGIVPTAPHLPALNGMERNGMERNGNTSCPEAANTPPSVPAVLEFSCVGVDPTWELTQDQLDEWSRLFPHLNVLNECRAAKAWVDASPERRKTAKGMRRFLVGWIGRSQDRKPSPAVASVGGRPELPRIGDMADDAD